jgi:monooxygenase
LNFTSGYVQRALATLPHQGSKRPWKVYQNYLFDMMIMRFGAINDGIMEFKRAKS